MSPARREQRHRPSAWRRANFVVGAAVREQLGLGLAARAPEAIPACALPRPSATASAKVGEEHGEPEPQHDLQQKLTFSAPVAMSLSRSTVVRTDTTATTNMTGFLARLFGFSFRNASPMAGTSMRASSMLADLDWFIRNSSEFVLGGQPLGHAAASNSVISLARSTTPPKASVMPRMMVDALGGLAAPRSSNQERGFTTNRIDLSHLAVIEALRKSGPPTWRSARRSDPAPRQGRTSGRRRSGSRPPEDRQTEARS